MVVAGRVSQSSQSDLSVIEEQRRGSSSIWEAPLQLQSSSWGVVRGVARRPLAVYGIYN
jgi:hypothetical protein